MSLHQSLWHWAPNNTQDLVQDSGLSTAKCPSAPCMAERITISLFARHRTTHTRSTLKGREHIPPLLVLFPCDELPGSACPPLNSKHASPVTAPPARPRPPPSDRHRPSPTAACRCLATTHIHRQPANAARHRREAVRGAHTRSFVSSISAYSY